MRKEKILIIGARGGLAQITSRILLEENKKSQIIAIDSREQKYTINHSRYTYKKISYKRNAFEEVFQQHKFNKVIFLSRVTLSSLSQHAIKERQDLNTHGTQTILNLCEQYKVKKVLIMSSFHAYGALSDNPAFLTENNILRASEKFPEIRDLVEMDQNCLAWMYRNRDSIQTVLFRPANIIGPCLNNGITNFFTHPLSFYPIDYNPSVQLIHEYDMASIIVKAITNDHHGLYNVAPDNYLTLKEAVLTVNPKAIPMLVFALGGINRILNKTIIGVPNYLIDYLKYPCLLSNKKFLNDFGKECFKFTTQSALRSIKLKNIHRFL